MCYISASFSLSKKCYYRSCVRKNGNYIRIRATMFKIVIFVVACINFQQVVVTAFLPNPVGSLKSLGSLGSLLDNTKDNTDKIPDTQNQGYLSGIFGKIFEHADEAGKKIGGGIIDASNSIDTGLSTEVQRLKEKSEQFLKEAQDADISSCNRLYKKGRAALAGLVSDFDACLLHETKQIGDKIRDLINVIGKTQKNMSKQLQDVIEGTTSIGSGFCQGSLDFLKLVLSKQGISAAIQFSMFFPSVKACTEVTFYQLVKDTSRDIPMLLQDTGMCAQSTIKGLF